MFKSVFLLLELYICVVMLLVFRILVLVFSILDSHALCVSTFELWKCEFLLEFYKSIYIKVYLLFIFPVAPVVSIQGIDQSWYVGQENVKFTCSARSNPPARLFTWIRSVSPKRLKQAVYNVQGKEQLITTSPRI